MQLIGAATPDVPNQTPMPQPSKQLLNACPVPPMGIIVTLLAGCQSAILGGPQQREQNQKSKPTPGVTMMVHATKRGFKDCPGFLNSTGRLGPKRGRKCYVHSRGSPTKETKSEVKTYKTYARGHHDAPSISKCGSLVQPGAQIAALY